MLKKINRLSNFKIKTKQQTFDSPLFKLKVFTDGEDKARVGFIVSKKIDKRAVVRNKTKRVLAQAIKKFLPEINAGKKFIIIAKTKLDFTQLETLEGAVRTIFKKAEVIK